jgi:hypothetical protein
MQDMAPSQQTSAPGQMDKSSEPLREKPGSSRKWMRIGQVPLGQASCISHRLRPRPRAPDCGALRGCGLLEGGEARAARRAPGVLALAGQACWLREAMPWAQQSETGKKETRHSRVQSREETLLGAR